MATWAPPDQKINVAFQVHYKDFMPIIFDCKNYYNKFEHYPYNEKLYKASVETCNSLIGENAPSSEYCHFEIRTALDCVVRLKTRKLGDSDDIVGICKHHVNNAAKHISSRFGLNYKQLHHDLDASLRDIHNKPGHFI